MIELNGKSLLFTDLHCGLSNNKTSRLNICIKVVKDMLNSIKTEKIHNVIFAGDLFHSRTTLSVDTINVALKLVSALSQHCKVILIVGNHDCFLKNSADINSLNMFRDNSNVIVVDQATELMLNNQTCILVPWLADIQNKNTKYDIAIGHFDVSSKYLISSYVEDHSTGARATLKAEHLLNADEILNCENTTKSSYEVGSFVELVKPHGIIYAGHIHTHKEFMTKSRQFVFIGSPYEQNLGEIDSLHGYYLLDEHNKRSFKPIQNVPHHIQLKMSDVIAGNVNYADLKGNIVQKIYDVDVKPSDEVKINQLINDATPYEELLPDYKVTLEMTTAQEDASEHIELMQKSKLDYIKNYIDNIDAKTLDAQHLERKKLYNVLATYYKHVIDGDEK